MMYILGGILLLYALVEVIRALITNAPGPGEIPVYVKPVLPEHPTAHWNALTIIIIAVAIITVCLLMLASQVPDIR